jgi:primosomal protein N' (replication factor Y)
VTYYASVYPLVTTRALARPFTYEVPEDVVRGDVVSVRLGGARQRGVVIGLEDAPPAGVEAAPIERVVESLPAPLVELALWLADYYGSTPGRALALVAPPKRERRKELPQPAERDSLPGEPEPSALTESQQAALERIRGAFDGGGHFLLYGATGSGKTEVYLQAATEALRRDLGVIVLVPEIALAPQTVGRFRARFGDRVAVLHSSLSEAERRDERERIASREAPIVIGARSAVFAPLPRLGLICVDEEHDAAYKQESDPRYDARTVAAKRASLEGAVAVYGSATPRPESWERLERLDLGERIGVARPSVRVVDLRGEAGYPLSAPLLAELGKIAERGGKAILLLNRRGVAPRAPLPRLRRDAALPGLRRLPRAAPRRGVALPPLRLLRARAGELPRLRLGRAGTHRRRHATARARARGSRTGARALPARRGLRREARRARRHPPALRGSEPGRARRHADGREGPPLRGRVPRGRHRCGQRPRDARLPG